MKLLRALLFASVTIALASSAEGAAGCKKQKKKHQHHAIHGVVVDVQHKTSLSGTITVQVHHHKKGLKKKGAANQAVNAKPNNGKVGNGKKGAGVAARPAPQGQAKAPGAGKRHEHLKTFTVSRETRFEKEVRTGTGAKKTRATFSEVHKGTHVTIHAHHHHARKVEIHPHKMKQRAKRPSGLPPRKRPK